MTEVDLTTDQNAHVVITPLDNLGNPAQIDGVPAWSGGDPTVCAVTPAADGMSADFVTSGVGTTTAMITADADLGAGVSTISEQFTIVVSAAQAEKLGVQVTIVDKTP